MNSIKKISLITLICTFILLIFLYSCSDQNLEVGNSKPEISKLIENKTGLIEIKNGKEIGLLKTKSKFNSNTTYFKSKNDNSFIVLNNNENKYYLEKGIINDGKFIIESSFELTDNMDDNGNGNLIINNVNEKIIISQTYENGVFKDKVISSTNNQLAKGLCQRKAGETFSQCNSRETDEFCDDFVSTVAYITNPSIAILIAALCSC